MDYNKPKKEEKSGTLWGPCGMVETSRNKVRIKVGIK